MVIQSQYRTVLSSSEVQSEFRTVSPSSEVQSEFRTVTPPLYDFTLVSPNDNESFNPDNNNITFQYDVSQKEDKNSEVELILNGGAVDTQSLTGTATESFSTTQEVSYNSSNNWKVEAYELGVSSQKDFESFESGFGDWVNGGDLETSSDTWTRNLGSTGSSGTGPSSALDGSQYIYVETSDGEGANTAGDETIIEYPNSASSIKFAYHMFGSEIGTLYLEGYDGSSWNEIWSVSGDQGDQWNEETQEFNSFNRIRFRNVAAGGFEGDTSLDEIYINPVFGKDSSTVESSTTRTFSVEDVNLSATLTSPSDTETFSYPNREIDFSYSITTNVSSNTSRLFIDGTEERTNNHSGDESITESVSISPSTNNWYVELEADDFPESTTSGTRSFTVEEPVIELTFDSPVDNLQQAKRFLDLVYSLNVESQGSVELVVDGVTKSTHSTPIDNQQFTESLQELDRDGQSKTWELQYTDTSGDASDQTVSRSFTIRVIETAQSTNQI